MDDIRIYLGGEGYPYHRLRKQQCKKYNTDDKYALPRLARLPDGVY